MKAKKILFIAQEIVPFTENSEIGENCRRLPQSIQEKSHEIRTFMPKWGTINERRNQLHEVIRLSGMNLIIDETDHPLIIKVASLQMARMQVYFIDNDDYFKNRQEVADTNQMEYEDNDERTIFFARGVLETVKKLRWCPDVIHCHGWIGALIGLYIKTFYREEPSFRDSKVVISIYNDEFESTFNDNFLNKILIKNMQKIDFSDVQSPITYAELCKLAIRYADGVIQNSEHIHEGLMDYAKSLNKPVLEYQTSENYVDACDAFYDSVFSQNQ